MKTILVPLEESEVLASVFETVLIVARGFGSYIEGLHVRPALGVVGAGAEGFVTTGLVERFAREEAERTRRVGELFTTFVDRHGVRRGEGLGDGEGPCVGRLDETASGGAGVGNRGRVFDLIVVGRPARATITPSMSTLEAALFESGRPILIAPPEPPRSLGERVLIAWNGSTETARTVAFAAPFLARAKAVVVLSVEHGMVPGPSGAEAVQHLARNGVAAEAVAVPASKRAVGEVILDEAAARGADLLIKGAYTQSRLRQLIFGGATSHILAAAELPVFMAH